MDIRIFGADLRFVGICDSAAGWAEEAFGEAGRFVLTVPQRDGGLFRCGAHLLIPGTEDGFVIESVRTDGTETEVRGRSVLSYLSRRIVSRPIAADGRAEGILLDLAAEFLPDVLPGSLSVLDFGLSENAAAATEIGPLSEVAAEIAASAGLGVRLAFRPEDGFVFSVRRPTAGSVFLSRSRGNLLSLSRLIDESSAANRILVVGSGGRTAVVEAEDRGPLREAYENAEDLAFSRFENEEAYLAALRARGASRLVRRRPVRRLDAEADEASARQILPGDICPVTDSVLGIRTEVFCRARRIDFTKKKTTYSVSLDVTAEE